MAKLYAICLDAFPEIALLSEHLVGSSFVRSDLICSGAFTCATMTSMISGTIGSEIVPGGIGYHTTYQTEFLKWRESGQCLTDYLKIPINIHNHVPWMSHNIIGVQLSSEDKTKHYRDHQSTSTNDSVSVFKNFVTKTDGPITYSSTNPELTLNTFTRWNDPELKKIFYLNETEYIKHIQLKPGPMLFWTDLCHWHEAVYYPQGQDGLGIIDESDALTDTVDWLKKWDFDEPNSIFFIYADHSHRVESYLDPPGYNTWVYFKDNRPNRLTLHRSIASADFYHLALKIFDFKGIDRSIWSTDPTNLTNPTNPTNLTNPTNPTGFKFENRIFACEDARGDLPIKTIASTFLRGCYYEDKWISIAEYCNDIDELKNREANRSDPNLRFNHNSYYLIISPITNKYTYTVYTYSSESLDDLSAAFSIKSDGPLNDRIRVDPIHELTQNIIDLAKKLIKLIH